MGGANGEVRAGQMILESLHFANRPSQHSVHERPRAPAKETVSLTAACGGVRMWKSW
jgi:hypothetical protein